MLQEQDKYPSAKYGTFPIWKGVIVLPRNLTRERVIVLSSTFTHTILIALVPQNSKRFIGIGRISKFHAGAGIKQNQLLLPLPRTTKMNVLGHHYFAQKRCKTSQIKFKLALHSLSQKFGLSGGHPTFGDEPLTPLSTQTLSLIV
jgi:hypothetical protein